MTPLCWECNNKPGVTLALSTDGDNQVLLCAECAGIEPEDDYPIEDEMSQSYWDSVQ